MCVYVCMYVCMYVCVCVLESSPDDLVQDVKQQDDQDEANGHDDRRHGSDRQPSIAIGGELD